MSAIRAAFSRRFPEKSGLVEPTTIGIVADLAPDAAVAAMDQAIRRQGHIGTQYEWLARYALQSGLAALEIANHRPAPTKSRPVFYEALVAEVVGEGHEARLRKDVRDERMLLFRPFRFPMLRMDKYETVAIAREHGFLDILGSTWFCHAPARNGMPCGRCYTCRQTKASGIVREYAKTGPCELVLDGIDALKGCVKRILRRNGTSRS